MPVTTVKLAMGQLLVEGGKLDDNLQRAVKSIREAASRGRRLIVLPECLDLGWTHPSAAELAQPIPGATSAPLCQAAREAGVYVAAGLTERDGARLYNAAVLIDPSGQILLKHRKINVLAIAQHMYSTGDRLAVAHTPLGTVGLNVCADNFPDSLSLGHTLGRMGAQIILSPCAWAVDADHDPVAEPYGGLWRESYVPLARLYEMPVIGTSNVGWLSEGPWKGRKCIGCSLAVDGRGEIVAEGPYGDGAEALVEVSVELVPRTATGTSIAGMLKRKGYDGP
ncbi:MAG: carbon-nitrogen hydrolase family protein [Planctomycetota bacterium]|jgi:predicted amidohydrolase